MTITTERLILRELTPDDYDALYRVLADSDIMKHYPYTFDEARVRNWINKNIERYRVFGFGLYAVCEKESGEMIGDCGITMQNINSFIRPEIGYHIRADKQRNGYASEAAAAWRDWAFENTPFKCLYSYMHADNIPSIGVAKKIGMRFFEDYHEDGEGRICVFEVTKDKTELELRKITSENVWDIVKLKVNEEQENYVASNIYSLAEAFAARESGQIALPFGIYCDSRPIGFVMLGYGEASEESKPKISAGNYSIWRFMIDRKYQNQGFGKEAMKKVLEYIHTFPCGKAEYCWLSYEPENTVAKSLYNKFGFNEKGEECDGEVVAVIKL